MVIRIPSRSAISLCRQVYCFSFEREVTTFVSIRVSDLKTMDSLPWHIILFMFRRPLWRPNNSSLYRNRQRLLPPFLLLFNANPLRFFCINSLWPSWHDTYSRLRNDASSSLVSSKSSAFVIYLTLTTRTCSATPQPCADTDTVPSKSRRPSGNNRYNLASIWVGRRKR